MFVYKLLLLGRADGGSGEISGRGVKLLQESHQRQSAEPAGGGARLLPLPLPPSPLPPHCTGDGEGEGEVHRIGGHQNNDCPPPVASHAEVRPHPLTPEPRPLPHTLTSYLYTLFHSYQFGPKNSQTLAKNASHTESHDSHVISSVQGS